MPATPHTERHFGANQTLRDVVIGMADGLTVPFALAAGLSGAVSSTSIIVTAGLAEIAAGSIAMGLGGFLAARGDSDHYASEEQREWNEVRDKPGAEEAEIAEVLGRYGLTATEIEPLIAGLRRQPSAWVDFMMRFELGLEKPEPNRATRSAITIGVSYIAGGLVPLAPYFFVQTPIKALEISIAVTAAALFGFGLAKGRFTGAGSLRSGLQTLFVGGIAAAAAFGLAKLFSAS